MRRQPIVTFLVAVAGALVAGCFTSSPDDSDVAAFAGSGSGSGSSIDASPDSSTDARADANSDASTDAAADATPDAGCTAQPEPACPPAPPGMEPQNPMIASGSQCRGACGANCPSTCRNGTPASTCLEWQTADCRWHAKVCEYPVLECGSHAGCREHDACYDTCATDPDPPACRGRCDADCTNTYGYAQCIGWALGNGPYDSWLSFAGTPTSYTYDSTCY